MVDFYQREQPRPVYYIKHLDGTYSVASPQFFEESKKVQQCTEIINAAWDAVPKDLRVNDGADPTGNQLPSAVRALAARVAESNRGVTEAVARVIYEQWASDPQYRPWVPGGNSHKQEEARSLARDTLATVAQKREITELIISKSGSTFTVDQPSLPGSPPVGRATTIEAAIGAWFIGNQTRLGFKILNDESAEKAVSDYRARKVNQR